MLALRRVEPVRLLQQRCRKGMSFRNGVKSVQESTYFFQLLLIHHGKGDYGSCMTEVTEENGQMRNICMGCKQANACQRAKAENFWDYLSKSLRSDRN